MSGPGVERKIDSRVIYVAIPQPEQLFLEFYYFMLSTVYFILFPYLLSAGPTLQN